MQAARAPRHPKTERWSRRRRRLCRRTAVEASSGCSAMAKRWDASDPVARSCLTYEEKSRCHLTVARMVRGGKARTPCPRAFRAHNSVGTVSMTFATCEVSATVD